MVPAQPTDKEKDGANKLADKLNGKKVALLFDSREVEDIEEEQKLTLDIYSDENGNEYWHDTLVDHLVQMGPKSGGYTEFEGKDRKEVDELRDLALEICAKMNEAFKDNIYNLHPLEANDKGNIYFFRWEDLSLPLSPDDLPPFIHVGLYPDGTVASFADTLMYADVPEEEPIEDGNSDETIAN